MSRPDVDSLMCLHVPCTYTYTRTFALTFGFCHLPFDLTVADIIVMNAAND